MTRSHWRLNEAWGGAIERSLMSGLPWSARIAGSRCRILEVAQNLLGIAAPAVFDRVIDEKLRQVTPRQIALAEHVLGHSRVIQRHVVVRDVVDDELHDRPGRPV